MLTQRGESYTSHSSLLNPILVIDGTCLSGQKLRGTILRWEKHGNVCQRLKAGVNCVSVERPGLCSAGLNFKAGSGFHAKQSREETRCHRKELLNFNDLFYYVLEDSIVSLSPGSKKRINWTENGGAGKLRVIRRDVNGAWGWIFPILYALK